eukprot:Opistho-2@89431
MVMRQDVDGMNAGFFSQRLCATRPRVIVLSVIIATIIWSMAFLTFFGYAGVGPAHLFSVGEWVTRVRGADAPGGQKVNVFMAGVVGAAPAGNLAGQLQVDSGVRGPDAVALPVVQSTSETHTHQQSESTPGPVVRSGHPDTFQSVVMSRPSLSQATVLFSSAGIATSVSLNQPLGVRVATAAVQNSEAPSALSVRVSEQTTAMALSITVGHVQGFAGGEQAGTTAVAVSIHPTSTLNPLPQPTSTQRDAITDAVAALAMSPSVNRDGAGFDSTASAATVSSPSLADITTFAISVADAPSAESLKAFNDVHSACLHYSPDDSYIRSTAANCKWPSVPPVRFGRPRVDSVGITCELLLKIVHEEMFIKRRYGYYVNAGTALGAIRDGGLLYGDTDVDLHVFVPNVKLSDRTCAQGVGEYSPQANVTYVATLNAMVNVSVSQYGVKTSWHQPVEEVQNYIRFNGEMTGDATGQCGADLVFTPFELSGEPPFCNCPFGHDGAVRRCTEDVPAYVSTFYGGTWWLRMPEFKGFASIRLGPKAGLNAKTYSQISALMQPLETADSDRDGKLNGTELLAALYKQGMPDQDVQAMATDHWSWLEAQLPRVNYIYEFARNLTMFGPDFCAAY